MHYQSELILNVKEEKLGRDKKNRQRGHEENNTADVVSGGLDLVSI